MKSFMAALRSLVLPFGRTAGRRIILDGEAGRIRIHDDADLLIAELSPDTPEGGGLWTRGTQLRPLTAALTGGALKLDTIDPDTTAVPALVLLDTDGTTYVSLIQSSGARVAGHTEGRVILQSTGTGRGRVFVTPDGTTLPPGYPAAGCDLEVFGAIDAHDLVRAESGLRVVGTAAVYGNALVAGPLRVEGASTLVGDTTVSGALTTTTGVTAGGRLAGANLRCGRATTPAPGTGGGQTEVTVTFSTPMVGTPRVVLTPVSATTDVLNTNIRWVTDAISSTGFTVRAYRGTNAATTFDYVAVSA
ncbi:hypothetical protein [Streptomyces albidoflavus]|uniref:hypothetical protein n=1 Tax=Streptomyces albidoflavus TaxID=1886 RepID=UPI0033247E61